MSGPHDVGQGRERGRQPVVGQIDAGGQRDQRAVGERNAHRLPLAAVLQAAEEPARGAESLEALAAGGRRFRPRTCTER